MIAETIKATERSNGALPDPEVPLPPPEQLVLKEDNVKVTIALKKSSVDFFKKEAKKHHTSYQKMIRQLVDWYKRVSNESYKSALCVDGAQLVVEAVGKLTWNREIQVNKHHCYT